MCHNFAHRKPINNHFISKPGSIARGSINFIACTNTVSNSFVQAFFYGYTPAATNFPIMKYHAVNESTGNTAWKKVVSGSASSNSMYQTEERCLQDDSILPTDGKQAENNEDSFDLFLKRRLPRPKPSSDLYLSLQKLFESTPS